MIGEQRSRPAGNGPATKSLIDDSIVIQPSQLDPQVARELTDRIKVAVEATWHLIAEAYTSRAWSALGYSSWDDYCTREFGTSRIRLPREERQEVVSSLREQGLSIRAIAAVTGNDKNTVMETLHQVSEIHTPEPIDVVVDRETGEIDEPLTDEQCEAIEHERATSQSITGIDGKTYAMRAAPEGTRSSNVKTYKGASTDKAISSTLPILEGIASRYEALTTGDLFGLTPDLLTDYDKRLTEIMSGLRAGRQTIKERTLDSAERRSPIATAFLSLSVDVSRIGSRLRKLAKDDRVPRNRDALRTYKADLIRLQDAVQVMVDALGGGDE